MRKADLDMVMWLREQIAEDMEQDRRWLGAARRNGKATARERLAQHAAHAAILDRCEHAESAMSSRVSSYLRGQDDGYREACLDAVRDVAAALAHRPGYRDEWRPE